ncbi:MAG TPA: lysylphosphatidylglycerol synthase transmembrane domain-containing protein [Gaiellaceae bacterium]|nr:lysylphosphatidylglycerol synthase transmembrane domain-containing protein [Gaiellaceae bacterium]
MGTLVDTVAAADARLALFALVFHLSNLGFRSLAWRNVLRAAYPDRPVPLLGVAGAYVAGMAVNSFTPARGGDLVKIGLVRSRVRDSSVATIGSSMGVVAALDALVGLTIVLLLASFGALPSPPGLPALPSAPALVADHPVPAIVVAAILAVCGVALGRRVAPRVLALWQNVRRGFSILASPRRYATEVVPVQLAAWGCRLGAAYFLLAALGVPASLTAAAIVVVVGGLSTLVPTPGGIGTQQVLLAYLLHTTASTATIVSFSVGMQAAVTTLNLALGLAAAMLMLRTLRPVGALRALRR